MLMSKKFITAYTYKHTAKCNLSHPVGESMTIPDESLTVRELFDRYRTGAPLDKFNRGTTYLPDDYDGDEFDAYDPIEDAIDLTDVENVTYEAFNRANEAQQELDRLKNHASKNRTKSFNNHVDVAASSPPPTE